VKTFVGIGIISVGVVTKVDVALTIEVVVGKDCSVTVGVVVSGKPVISIVRVEVGIISITRVTAIFEPKVSGVQAVINNKSRGNIPCFQLFLH
jgi:hypothetical protein